MRIPDSIKEDHVLAAIQALDAGIDHPFGQAKKYELVHHGKRYAPKAVLGIAAKHATGKEFTPYDFGGGDKPRKANEYLRNLGFQIVEKGEPFDEEETSTATYLLTWNPNHYEWASLEEQIHEVRNSGKCHDKWSTGATKRIEPGDRLFIFKQGDSPRGVIASGVFTSDVHQVPHWNPDKRAEGKESNSARIEIRMLVSPDDVLAVEHLHKPPLNEINWNSQASGPEIAPHAVSKLTQLWNQHYQSITGAMTNTKIDPDRIGRIKEIFQRNYPAFKSFKDAGERFYVDEDTYKRKAVEKAQPLLHPYVSGNQKIDDDVSAASVINEILDLTNFMNWRDKSYIRDELLNTEGRWKTYFGLLIECMACDDTGEAEEKINALTSWLDEIGCSANISKILPTYLLMLWDPKLHISIKPLIFDRFLTRLGVEKLGNGKRLTATEYSRVLKAMKDLRRQLADWQPRDLLDIQSLYYVVEGKADSDADEQATLSRTQDSTKDPEYTIDDAMDGLFLSRESFEEELLSNFVDEPNQAASFSIFSPSMN